MAWARNGTPHTLSSAGDTIEITDLTANKFNVFLNNIISASTNATTVQRFNADSNTVYAQRRSSNGGADATGTSLSSLSIMIPNYLDSGMNDFAVAYVCSISGKEKLMIAFSMNNGNTAGAGTAPQRREGVAKYVPSPDADITQFRNVEVSAQDNAVGSNTSALGGDETETVTLQNGTIFEETDTNKAYIWNATSQTWTQL